MKHPLEVDPATLFQIGSITKTVTGTLALQLVEQGELDLDAPIRRYLPALGSRTPTSPSASRCAISSPTGGWFGDHFSDPSRGDGALERVLPELAELPQLAPLGQIWSYCNSAFYVAGRHRGAHRQAVRVGRARARARAARDEPQLLLSRGGAEPSVRRRTPQRRRANDRRAALGARPRREVAGGITFATSSAMRASTSVRSPGH